MGRLFGTDGIRGLANADLTATLAFDVAASAADVLSQQVGGRSSGRPVAVVGRDPRASGEFLSSAVVAGLASTGVDVFDAGVLPTPAIAFLTAQMNADLGVMLSASHNPAPDNGIKLFARGGHKLDDAVEDAIESRLGREHAHPTGSDVGRVRSLGLGPELYVEHIVQVCPAPLDGLKVVVDCAHGAAFAVAPEVLRRLGAEVTTLGVNPDGYNINEGCGSTHLEPLQEAVRRVGADVGIAHDGDADRCLAVDATGTIIDGDQILAILALSLRDAGKLSSDTVVATVMSNLGFKIAMRREGITVVDTKVGDRYVLEAMKAGGYSLGGEQSGHVVMLESATTGDGLLTAVHLLARVAATGKPLADLGTVMDRLPQVLINVRDVDKSRVSSSESLSAAVAGAEAQLGETGRVLLRPSGTEAVVRVMVEAADAGTAREVADRLAEVVRSELPL